MAQRTGPEPLSNILRRVMTALANRVRPTRDAPPPRLHPHAGRAAAPLCKSIKEPKPNGGV